MRAIVVSLENQRLDLIRESADYTLPASLCHYKDIRSPPVSA